MARTYKRDSRGRFAGGGGSGSRPAARPVSRGTNRLTRNNSGQITGTGNGATARGGRLRTAAGNQRATQTARAKGGARAGVIKGRVTRNPGAGAKLAASGAKPTRAVRRTAKRVSPSGAIRKTDVLRARLENSLSKNVEQRNKAGLNGAKPRSIENDQTRLQRAQKRIAGQKRNPQAGAKLAARGKISSQTDFTTLKRRYDRTRPQSSGLTNNVDDRRGGMGPAYTRRLLNSMGTRARATKTYSTMASRPLNELKPATVRAPYGRFSTVKNPAPARSFPSQAVGRTKKGELVARAGRAAAKASKPRRRR